MKLATILGAVLLLASASATAGAYKCTDAKGKVTYQQQPCPSTATATKMKVDAPSWSLVKKDLNDYGSAEIFFDTDGVKQVGAFRRARFKSVGRFHGASKTMEQVYYQYYNCPEGKVSTKVYDHVAYEQDIVREASNHLRWHPMTDSYLNDAAAVSDKICDG